MQVFSSEPEIANHLTGIETLAYISSSFAIGFGGELGYSFMADKFFFTVPKLNINVGF